MRAPVSHRFVRLLVGMGLAGALLLPAIGAPARAADPLVLRAGTDQKIKSLNPFAAVVVAEYEAFTLNYDLLVNFGANIEPVPGFAASWSQSTDGLTWTFKMQPGLKWSDGTAATSEDARWTYQLMLDALAKEVTLGSGYLDGYLPAAGVTSVTAPDPETLVVTTEFPSTLILYVYAPILPKHVWEKVPFDDIASGTYTNPPPVVGTGPYQAVETKEGNFTRFVKNPEWRGDPLAADEVVLTTFASADTMTQALRKGEIDYARGVLPDQFKALVGEPNIVTVEGVSNGYTELAFNCYSRNGGVIEGGGASTRALQDPAFRDALGYAIDKQELVDKQLAGYGLPGDTIIPPFHARWHVPPANPRTFDIEKAKSLLDAAGYKLDGDGRRLDKEGKQITLRLTWPDSEADNGTSAQFIAAWFEELGIKVDASVTEEGQLIDQLLPPEADGKAQFDMFIWGWVGDPDPNSLLKFFLAEEIGVSSDSFYENPKYDELYDAQRKEADEGKRKALLTEMQELIYNEAPYHVLFYDSELHAYRTDRFTNWQNQPAANGTPLFGQGSYGYWGIQAVAPATPTPAATAEPGASAAPTPAPSADGDGAAGDNTPLLIGIVVAVIVVAGVILAVVFRRRQAREEEE
jgi:peptide/nickel transport system substrate-binding protein